MTSARRVRGGVVVLHSDFIGIFGQSPFFFFSDKREKGSQILF